MLFGMTVALAACSSPPTGLDSPVPEERMSAIVKAAREKDQSAIPALITFLNSDDGAVRVASIRTLEVLTGQTLGYDHAAPEWKRREMIRAWVEWDKQRTTPSASKTTGPKG
jgi:HEAT repeat protein